MTGPLPQLPYYEAIKQIGHGGTSLVYLAIDLRTGFPVAIKMLFRHAFRNEAMRQKFQAEANRYLYLDHPGIVRLRDFIMREDGSFLVMEYVEGKTLEDYINTVTGPIAGEVAVAMLSEVCEALSFAHEQKVVHLDIKPSNIMITDDGQLKLLDFGIAHEQTEAPSGKVEGTPMYMAPEQLTLDKVDTRTDIYALGVTLFQMLTGRSPYEGYTDRYQLFEAIKSKPFPHTADFYPHVDEGLQRIIRKATEKKKEKRYQHCPALLSDLRSVFAA